MESLLLITLPEVVEHQQGFYKCTSSTVVNNGAVRELR
nr:MAG TPA: hypothetical protein [Caudoviricetes sp.]